MRFIVEVLRYKKYIGILYAAFLMFCYGLQGQTLADYLVETAANAPSLKAMKIAQEGTIQQLKYIGGLPKTTIGVGYFISQPETRIGDYSAQFHIRQPIHWFGTRKAQKAVTLTQSELENTAIAIEKRRLFLAVKKKYYQIYAITAKQKVLQQQDTILKRYQMKLKGDSIVSNTARVAALKISIARNNLHYKEEILKGDLLNAQSAFNQLLNREGFEPIIVPDNLIIPDEEPTLILDEVTYHPELEKYEHWNRLWDQRKKVNRKKAMPEWNLGLDYIAVDKQFNTVVQNNGNDIVMPYISVSLPLFSKSYKGISNQYTVAQNKMEEERITTENSLSHRLETAMNDRITARIQYHTQQKNITETQAVFQLLQQPTALDSADAETVLEVQQLVLNFEEKKIEAVQAYFVHTAVLNYLN